MKQQQNRNRNSEEGLQSDGEGKQRAREAAPSQTAAGTAGEGHGQLWSPTHTLQAPGIMLHRQEGRKASAKEHQPQSCEEGQARGPVPERQLSRDNRRPRLEVTQLLQGLLSGPGVF